MSQNVDALHRHVRSSQSATDRALTALRTLGHCENRMSKALAQEVDNDDPHVDAIFRLAQQVKIALPNDQWSDVLAALEQYNGILTALDQTLTAYTSSMRSNA